MSILSEKSFMFKQTHVLPLFFLIFSGDYVLYSSFNTLDNVILMEGTEQNNFGSLVLDR